MPKTETRHIRLKIGYEERIVPLLEKRETISDFVHESLDKEIVRRSVQQ